MTCYITHSWWENLDPLMLIGCALGAPDEAVFLERLTFDLTGGASYSIFEFEDEDVYNDILAFVGDVNTWNYVAFGSYRMQATDAPGPARLCIENLNDESYDIAGFHNNHLIVQESDGWYGSVIYRPHNYAEAVEWVMSHSDDTVASSTR